MAASCLFGQASFFIHIQAFGVALHLGDYCPAYSSIIGNEEANKLAKLTSTQNPTNPNYKTQAYMGTLHKCELLKEWRFRWTNTPNPPCSGFHLANRIPPTLKPTERFTQMDHQMFSRLVQCQTGHAHIREYYKKFVPTEHMGFIKCSGAFNKDDNYRMHKRERERRGGGTNTI